MSVAREPLEPVAQFVVDNLAEIAALTARAEEAERTLTERSDLMTREMNRFELARQENEKRLVTGIHAARAALRELVEASLHADPFPWARAMDHARATMKEWDE